MSAKREIRGTTISHWKAAPRDASGEWYIYDSAGDCINCVAFTPTPTILDAMEKAFRIGHHVGYDKGLSVPPYGPRHPD